ncbi:hypothetical protein [Ruficoccus sp. ZRK36]|uniref:hypothetical protein n=1 Tax=Ruficoccus sp. ZRK36 TaxID=2866311 RepID=UPI001C736F93|nr:hypothetical protein [Ruficoccus sp. ZRK36]QYY36550.1 hypothetical protein K0V07_03545 [Ruficoccus sp. ZRK36]
MSQDSNTENGSSAKKKLSLKRGSTPRKEEAAPPPPVKREDGPPSAPRMKLSPKREQQEPSSPPPAAVDPLVPPPPAPKQPTIKPRLKTDDKQDEPKQTPPPPSASIKDISPPPAATPPPVAPSDSKLSPPPTSTQRPPEDAPPPLPPVIGPKTSAGTPPPPPFTPPEGLTDSDLEVKPVKTKSSKGILPVMLTFLIILIAIAGVAFAFMKLLGGTENASEFVEWESNTPEDANNGPSAIGSVEDPQPSTDGTVGDWNRGPLLPDDVQPSTPASSDTADIPDSPTLADPQSGPGQPNPAVTAWIEQLRPNVIRGSRMTIEGVNYHIGDQVSQAPVILWIGHDRDLGLLTFEDANGIIYEKDY